MGVSPVDLGLLVEKLGKEKVVLIPLSEYQALLDRLARLEEIEAKTTGRIGPELAQNQFAAFSDSQAGGNPVLLKGLWGPIVINEDDFAAARRSLFSSLNDTTI